MPQRLTLPTSNPGRQNASAYSQRGRYLCSATLISLIMSENVKHQAEPMCQASSGTAHHVAQPACENFLYGFKAARRAARAAAAARSPPLPLDAPAAAAPTPVGWRETQNPGHHRRIAITGVQPLNVVSMLPLPLLSEAGRTRQERLRRRLRRSSTLDRTCPTVPEFAAIGSRDNNGPRMAGPLLRLSGMPVNNPTA